MSAHQSLAAAARRDDSEPSPRRREDGPRPTMNELLASCAAANAVSTPPDAPEPASPDESEGERKSEQGNAYGDEGAAPVGSDRDAA